MPASWAETLGMRVVMPQTPSPAQRIEVERLLGRRPQGAFLLAVIHTDGRPVVIANEPLLDDGTPMPTRYWLLDAALTASVARLESAGGVRSAEAAADPDELRAAHRAYAAERDSLLDCRFAGPRPSGGVGGTAVGVKCLHAHVAYRLVGGADPVGQWALERLHPERMFG